jgi:aldehyde dehydrogenase
LAVDHFRYFASVIRAEESSIAELDSQTVTIALSEPLGDCADYSWNFPILMAETGSGISCGNTVVLKPAESTPISILVLMELIGDILPPGVVNIVNGFGAELGRALVTKKYQKLHLQVRHLQVV